MSFPSRVRSETNPKGSQIFASLRKILLFVASTFSLRNETLFVSFWTKYIPLGVLL